MRVAMISRPSLVACIHPEGDTGSLEGFGRGDRLGTERWLIDQMLTNGHSRCSAISVLVGSTAGL